MKKKFIAKFSKDYAALQTGGRKHDSSYFRLRIAHKKIAYVNFLVKNVDQLVIVASLSFPKFKSGLIDRFLTLAHWSGKQAVIILTKRDLVTASEVVAAQAVYQNLPYRLYTLANRPNPSAIPASSPNTPATAALSPVPNSTKRGQKLFLKIREEVFKDYRSAVVGHSGVGKTALLTRIDPQYHGRVNTVSAFTERGRHTTTRVTRHEFDFGGEVFDMPGLKELDFTDVTKRDLRICYPEFEVLAPECTFKNCLHDHEPKCAVRTAYEAGKIHPIRYRNYLQILATLEKH